MSDSEDPGGGPGGSPFTVNNTTPSVQTTNTPDRHTSPSENTAADQSNASPSVATPTLNQEEPIESANLLASHISSVQGSAASNDGNDRSLISQLTNDEEMATTPSLAAEPAANTSTARLERRVQDFLEQTIDTDENLSDAADLEAQRNSLGAGPSALEPGAGRCVQGMASQTPVSAAAASAAQPLSTGASQADPQYSVEQAARWGEARNARA